MPSTWLLGILLATAQASPKDIRPPIARFVKRAPLESLAPVRVDRVQTGAGLANHWARNKGLQGRVLWIDGTANLDKLSTSEAVREIVREAHDIGFNTLVLDVKPIVGRVLYRSRIADKLVQWRDKLLPLDFDPLEIMTQACRENDLSLFVSMNAFSEGHLYAKREAGPTSDLGDPGWGYSHPEHQSVQMVSDPLIRFSNGPPRALFPKIDATAPRDLALFTNSRAAADTETFVGLNARDKVVPPEDPSATRWLGARGAGAEWLRRWAQVGSKASYETRARFIRAAEEQTQIPLMMNPHDPVVQERVLKIVQEIASKYDIDGLLFDDRLRFAGLGADFSDVVRASFEEWLGRPVSWPDDVFTWTVTPQLATGVRPGPLWDAWLTWRAAEIKNFVARAGATLRKSRPRAKFGIYAGSWYGDYPRFGSNYGAPDLEAGYTFLTPAYASTGFAELLDVLIVGCYYPVPTVYEAMVQGLPAGRTVEAGAVIGNRVARDACWVYAGIMLADFYENPDNLTSALQAAASASQGVMVFDLSHKFSQFAPILRKAFRLHKDPPHSAPGLLERVRQSRKRFDALGGHEIPVPFYEGQPGAGF